MWFDDVLHTHGRVHTNPEAAVSYPDVAVAVTEAVAEAVAVWVCTLPIAYCT